MPAIRIKRGTRAQLEAAKAAGTLAAGEPYLITDEGALAVGTAANAYAVAAAGAHDHASNKLSQTNTHESADTDSATTALHHTLGTGPNQAAAGNHTHTASAIGAEPALGNPASSGYVLSSTTGGTRSWIAPPSGGDSLNPFLLMGA